MTFRPKPHKKKKAARLFSRLVLAASLFAMSDGVSSALAQEAQGKEIIVAQNNPFRGFNPFAPIQRLFGGNQRGGQYGRQRIQRQQPAKQQKRKAKRPTGAPPKFEAQPKDPDAGLVLVVGDRMARGVADGLRFTLADKPQIRVEAITQDLAGFAGKGAPDWETEVLAKIRGEDVKAVVVMVGRRDMGKGFPADPPIEFMTAEWLDTYRNKVESFIRVVRQEKKPIVWAGLPPTYDELVNGDFTQLNSIFQGAAEDRRVRYVDIWDIFLAEDGSYSSYGPDVNGKNTKLRTKNRIGFTWAGYRKVAFFVERELSRLLGGYGGLAFEGVEDDPNFIVLTGRTTSPEALLLGGEDDKEIDKNSTAYRFFVRGEPLPPMPGRVDDPRIGVEGTSSLESSLPSGS